MAELEKRSGVHRETIRVYFRHGLLPEPQRPRRNVAVYGEEHVDAIAAIQRLQRENRLTLPEIGSLLNGVAPAAHIGANAFSEIERLVATRVGYDERLVPLESLVPKCTNTLNDARALERLGIVKIVTDDQGEALSLTDSHLVQIWGKMRAAGFSDNLGFGPEMLGFYLQAAEFVAGWEAKTFMERTRDKTPIEDAVHMLEAALPLMLDFFGMLRMRAFMRNIETGKVPTVAAIKDPSLT